MNPRDPYRESSGVLRNRLGITDPDHLAEFERDLAFFRVVELELSPLGGRFDFDHLRAIHRYILQDIFDWAGELRSVDTHALGIPHARPQFLTDELDRVFCQIATRPPSTTDPHAATDTIASHWSELTLVHPFRDGNSRTQRVFFDQMFRHAGWAVDWAGIDASAAHAARHMSVYGRPDYLADQLRHAVRPAAELADGRLATTLGNRSLLLASEHFRAMREHLKAGSTTPYGRPAQTRGRSIT
ncbi:cell filamentation protein Fic [Dietzia sp. SLG310A2-38A2]|uniref:Fic/DOC family protein n=1 Tax=Dietzia sp. SLG310A2-38A2 TaxID=1630643 RepID=UPI0015FE7493|nr:Fic family protein [Dietzia sp. SLG310A2-38A2]MBB1032607.1 cell filamentation protein Fic [Dietzia sp. SLG310A2-38A2]